MARIGRGLVLAFPFLCAVATLIVLIVDERRAAPRRRGRKSSEIL